MEVIKLILQFLGVLVLLGGGTLFALFAGMVWTTSEVRVEFRKWVRTAIRRARTSWASAELLVRTVRG